MNGMKNSKKMKSKIQHMEYQSAETKLLTKRRELDIAQEAFEKEKERFANKEKYNNALESKIRDKDADTQKQLIKYSKNLQALQNSKIKSQRKYKEEFNNNKQKEKECQELDQQLKIEQILSKKISKKAESLRKYDQYLNTTINQNQDQFESFSGLRTRHKTLNDANIRLNKKKEEIAKRTDELKHQINEYETKMADQVLVLNNDIADLRKEKERLQQQKYDIQSELEGSTKNNFEEKILDGKIFMAVHNLFHRCSQFNSQLKRKKNQKPAGLGKTTKDKRGKGDGLEKRSIIRSDEGKDRSPEKRGKNKSSVVNGSKEDPDEVSDKDFFNLHKTYKKLEFIMNNIEDYKHLLHVIRESKKSNKKKTNKFF